ncbi:hypothetical protein BGW36DRAFT_179646 [Talaromyces proteolyticus]|uniref:BHLH domain-containing protein n=1 Tax=Talaromyces proteolyticus TaxID=1131652 RepID=A0AAD4KNS2_9EURO|nr:uncharacterized protein BGW36DRAFT_179646 [Talaromyces proteolyticus]KAH8695980.1 hypothetical protein BGW36DRAFT_179646 [Talaromyces proteolyticus]
MSSFTSYQSNNSMMSWDDKHMQESWGYHLPVSFLPPNIWFSPGSSAGEISRHIEPFRGSIPAWVNQSCWTNLPPSERTNEFSLSSTQYAWYSSDNIETCFADNRSSSYVHFPRKGVATATLHSTYRQSNQWPQWPATKDQHSETPSNADTESSSRLQSSSVSPGQYTRPGLFEDTPSTSSDDNEIPTNSEALQLQWGSDSSFDSNMFIPPTLQASKSKATDTWLAWIESITASETVQWASDIMHQQVSLCGSVEAAHGHGLDDIQKRAEITVLGRGIQAKTLHDDRTAAQKVHLRAEKRRQIHNNSERKRREQLHQGFLDLCDIVPGLNIRTHTRKEILFRTARWLEQFLQDNERLKDQLGQLTAVNKARTVH